MRHYLLTRAAYGPGWSVDANRNRLAFSRGITIPSIRSQTSQRFEWLVLLHRQDALLEERMAAFAGAKFLYLDAVGTPSSVAWQGYGADWAGAIGDRDETVAMTRLDDDDGLAPWVMARIQGEVRARREILMLPNGIRVFRGRFTVVRHASNAMQTLVTPPGDTATVYDYGHRDARRFARVRDIDSRIAWLWSRHDDTISGWKAAHHPLIAPYMNMFMVEWSLFGEASRRTSQGLAGRVFR